MMDDFYFVVATVLLLSVIAGFWRVFRGPQPEDRLIAAQLLGTTAVAVLLVAAKAFDVPSLTLVGFVFSSLGAITIVAYVRYDELEENTENDRR